MYQLTTGKTQAWGIKGYEPPKVYHDPLKIKQNKENMAIACNKKKRPKRLLYIHNER